MEPKLNQVKPATVAEFFSRPNTHCKHTLAIDKNGYGFDPQYNNSIPVQCCLVGAVMYVYDCGRISPHIKPLKAAGGFKRLGELVDWNNAEERTQEEILALCIKAGV